MKDAEAILLLIPGVTEAQVFAKVLVRYEFPMSDETMMELQCAQARIEYVTGWKVEMTISAGKRLEPMPRTDNERDSGSISVSGETMDAFEALLASEKMLNAEFDGLERASDEALVNFERSVRSAIIEGGR